jgi:Rab GDP dissociation inhibitor
MPGLQLLGAIDEYFVQVSDVMEPVSDGSEDGCYISKGYDATTHFQSTAEDVLQMFKRITGKEVDLDANDPATAGQEQ